MQIDIYELNLRFPGWLDDIDQITGEMRGELLAWAFLNDYDELVSTAVFEAFYKKAEGSCRLEIAEWLMNLYVDQGQPCAWMYQTREMFWEGTKAFLEKWLPRENARHIHSMSFRDDIEAYKEERNATI